MCGRFSTNANLDALLALLGVDGAGVPLAEIIGARANIAPSEPIAVVTNVRASKPNAVVTRERAPIAPDVSPPRHVELFTWGLVPFWTKPGSKAQPPFNVRAESLLERPAFRSLITRHRAVVPAAGFYEWTKPSEATRGAKKVPYFLSRADGAPMALAAVWETHRDTQTGAHTHSCAIVTTEPSADVRAIHDRMPVIVEPDALERWLSANDIEPDTLRDVLRPLPDGALRAEARDPLASAQTLVLVDAPAAPPSAHEATSAERPQLALFDSDVLSQRKGSRYSRP